MQAILALEDGSVFHGAGFGARASSCGEVCFNTSMTGYQEILTDPSYKAQIVTMTYPLIGNYGVNRQDVESWQPHVAGFAVRELSPVVSNWRADASLSEYLEQNNIPGIQGIDTRALTRRLRVRGALNGLISTEDISEAEATAVKDDGTVVAEAEVALASGCGVRLFAGRVPHDQVQRYYGIVDVLALVLGGRPARARHDRRPARDHDTRFATTRRGTQAARHLRDHGLVRFPSHPSLRRLSCPAGLSVLHLRR